MITKEEDQASSEAGMHDRKELEETTHRTSSDRVAWTSTRNLATDRPEVATAVMVATAKDADRLKQKAGVRNVGRKAKTPVKTFALSWHPDEAATLNRTEMDRAATSALKAIGMEGHQAIIVCHNDTRHPHVHVIVNRVSPENGKLAKCGPNENRALDRWAYEYERDRGNIVSPNRAAKHERRDQLKQQYNADERRTYIRCKHASREDTSRAQDLRQRSTEQRARHKQEWADLSAGYQIEKRKLRDGWRAKFRDARKDFDAQQKGHWRQYCRDKWRRRREFEKLDSTFYGRLSLSIQAAQKQQASGNPSFEGLGAVRQTWMNMQNPELRGRTFEALEKEHVRRFKLWHERPLRAKLKRLGEGRALEYHDAYTKFQSERANLIYKQTKERNELRSQWDVAQQNRNRGKRNELRTHPDRGAGAKSLNKLREGQSNHRQEPNKALDALRASSRDVSKVKRQEADRDR